MEALSAEVFVPDYPTLSPYMLSPNKLFAKREAPAFPPFNSSNVHWSYFARNVVWQSVRMLGLAGGEVLVPAYHHGVEIEALVDAGATPVFYRVGPRWDVDLEDVEKKIGQQTRALYLIHYAGFPGPVLEMQELAKRYDLPLIEDCALSLLSADGETQLGTAGDIGIFCLYKALPVPNGGALIVNNHKRYALPPPSPPPMASVFSHTASALLKNIELRGGAPGRWVRSTARSLGHRAVKAGGIERVFTGTLNFNRAHVDLGISPLTLKIAHAQDMAQIVERRRQNYGFLVEQLGDLSPPLFETLPPGVSPLFYPMSVEDKPQVVEKMWAAGVGVVDFWRFHHPACDPAEYPEVMRLRNTVMEIPCHQDLDFETLSRMVGAVRKVLRAHRQHM